MRNIYARNTLRGPLRRGGEAVGYITLTTIVYENEEPIEHVLLHPICVFFHLMCAFKHCNIKLSLYY